MRERSKLAGLTAEGRSSATTLLVSSALEWLNEPAHAVAQEKRKLLGFTDNRQDAALQAGHFNDFVFVSLLRGAMLRAVVDAGRGRPAGRGVRLPCSTGLGFCRLERSAADALDAEPPRPGRWFAAMQERSLAKVLAHRVWTDLRRGWRFTNPSLSRLKLIEVDFVGLGDVAADGNRFPAILPELGSLDHDARRKVLRILLGAMLEGLARRYRGTRSCRSGHRCTEITVAPAGSVGDRQQGKTARAYNPVSEGPRQESHESA